MCELLVNGISNDFFYYVDALQHLTNIEEQPKSFLRRSLFINGSQSHKIIPRSCTRFVFELQPKITKNCDVFTHSEDFCIVSTRNYDFFIVVMRNCVAVFRNYGSQCDRTDTPTASQFDRNETHGQTV